jgi:hypothetical protein
MGAAKAGMLRRALMASIFVVIFEMGLAFFDMY